MAEHYELSLEFDSDDPEFARGVEVGFMYEGVQMAMFTGASRFSRPIHASNAEMAMRIAESFNCEFSAEELDDNFVQVTFVTRDEPVVERDE